MMPVTEFAKISQEANSLKKYWYLVTNPRSKNNITQAEDELHAKENVCRFWGIDPADRWLGINALTARRITAKHKGYILTGTADVFGYEQLSDYCKLIFAEFLNNFFAVWEYPENHLPVKINYIADQTPYLRVDFVKGGWLHILSPNEWY